MNEPIQDLCSQCGPEANEEIAWSEAMEYHPDLMPGQDIKRSASIYLSNHQTVEEKKLREQQDISGKMSCLISVRLGRWIH